MAACRRVATCSLPRSWARRSSPSGRRCSSPIGCDMARQCHLDTCPTGIATQREDLRAKFTGTPEQVERFALALAEDLRRELAAVGAREASARSSASRAGSWPRSADGDARPDAGRRRGVLERRSAASAGARVGRAIGPSGEASPLERRLRPRSTVRPRSAADGLALSTADRSFGAISAAHRARRPSGPVSLGLRGAAGQSFGAFATTGVELRLDGQANDYVAKGLSGGPSSLRRSPTLRRSRPPGDRRQHVPLWRDRRPAAFRRPGRDALRGPQLRRQRRGRGHRSARLRVHDRWDRRGPGPGRAPTSGRG